MSRLATIMVLVAILAGLWVVGWLLIWGVKPWFQQRGIGKPCTFMELKPLSGSPPALSLADLQGHVTLLNFWGTWCPPCRAELPHMAELRQRFAGQRAFRLVAISYPPDGRAADRQSVLDDTTGLLKQLNLVLPTYYDPGGRTFDAVDATIGFEGFPTTLLLDRQGVIRAIWVGYEPGVETEMERRVAELLGEAEK